MSNDKARWFERPQLKRTAPDRTAGNYYRSAADDGKAIGGIPLNSSEAAIVAVVRMAYKVAEAQIDRSARLARRLREAGDRVAGPRSDRQALDATEQLVFRAMMSFLGWVENAASDDGNPLKRLAVAQYRLLGSLLGLTSSEPPKTQEARAPEDASRRADAPSPADAAYRGEEAPRFPVRIQHAGKARRAVRIYAWEYAGDAGPPKTIPVKFYNVERGSRKPLQGEIVVTGKRSATLTLATSPSVPAGRWRAALCDAKGVQMGHIEIML
jgi:hypothetical protein